MQRTKKELYEALQRSNGIIAEMADQMADLELEAAESTARQETIERLIERRYKYVEENDLLRKLLAMYMPEIHQHRRW